MQTRTALMPHNAALNTLWDARLLCDICEERPWTQHARWHTALLCPACAEDEPPPYEPAPKEF